MNYKNCYSLLEKNIPVEIYPHSLGRCQLLEQLTQLILWKGKNVSDKDIKKGIVPRLRNKIMNKLDKKNFATLLACLIS